MARQADTAAGRMKAHTGIPAKLKDAHKNRNSKQPQSKSRLAKKKVLHVVVVCLKAFITITIKKISRSIGNRSQLYLLLALPSPASLELSLRKLVYVAQSVCVTHIMLWILVINNMTC